MACISVVVAGSSFLLHFNLNLGGCYSSIWRHQRSFSSSLTSTTRAGSNYSLKKSAAVSSSSSSSSSSLSLVETSTERRGGVLPLLFLSMDSVEEEEDDDDIFYLFNIAQQKITQDLHLPNETIFNEVASSSEGFVFTLQETTRDIHATNPFTGSRLLLPSTSSFPNIIGILRSSTSGEITHHVIRCHNKIHDDDPNIEHYLYEGKCKSKESNSFLFQRIDPQSTIKVGEMFDLCGRAILSPSLDTVVVLFILNEEEHLAFARVGPTPSSSWTSLSCNKSAGIIHSIIFHQGRLHVLDTHWALTIFDVLNNPSAPPLFLPPVEKPIQLVDDDKNDDAGYLVESPDGRDLFLVYREVEVDHSGDTANKTKAFKVYKLGKCNNYCYNWEQVETIGDLVFFVGCNASFSVSVGDFTPGLLKPNSIYFTDTFLVYRDEISDSGVFHLEDGSLHLYQIENENYKYGLTLPVWLMPSTTCRHIWAN